MMKPNLIFSFVDIELIEANLSLIFHKSDNTTLDIVTMH